MKSELSKARRMLGEKSVDAFARIYFKEYLKFPTSKAHQELYNLADKAFIVRNRRIVVAAPRGFGKTTVFVTVLVIYALCYRKEKYIIICSNTADRAQDKVNDVRKVILENALLQEDFPELFKSLDKTKTLSSWSKEEFVINDIKVGAFGYQQKVRGIRFGDARPSLLLIDDLDSENHRANLDQKNKVKDWFLGSLLKVGDEKTNIIVIGNVFHKFSIIGDLCSPEETHLWEQYIYKAVITFPKRMDLWQDCWRVRIKTEDYNGSKGPEAALLFYADHRDAMNEGALLLWPERYNLFNLMIEFQNDPATFNAELQNVPRQALNSAFDPEHRHFWQTSYKSLVELMQYLETGATFFAACDPSTGKRGMQGDPSAIVVAAVKDKVAYVLHADVRVRNINELIADIFSYAKRYRIQTFGIEVNGGQEYFFKTLMEKANSAGAMVNFKEINSVGDKKTRLESMSGAIRTAAVLLSREHISLLEEFSNFPFGRHDDGMDALQMCLSLAWSNTGGYDIDLIKKVTVFLQKQSAPLKIDSISEMLRRGAMGDFSSMDDYRRPWF